jgi:hypothetical protein
MCGMYIPEYFTRHPIKTGSTEVDQTLSILLEIRMIIGGLIAFILDNLVPGKLGEISILRKFRGYS